MTTSDGPIREVYVQPGESHLVERPTMLSTVLGSCVGVTFLVPRLGIGALCHPMLPQCPENRLAKLGKACRQRYVDLAIRDMAGALDVLGAVRAEVKVKLFGGGDVLAVGEDSLRPTIGKLNWESALRVLEEEGLTVAALRPGGSTGVHIQFKTGTGEVLLRRLDSASAIRFRDVTRVPNHVRTRR